MKSCRPNICDYSSSERCIAHFYLFRFCSRGSLIQVNPGKACVRWQRMAALGTFLASTKPRKLWVRQLHSFPCWPFPFHLKYNLMLPKNVRYGQIVFIFSWKVIMFEETNTPQAIKKVISPNPCLVLQRVTFSCSKITVNPKKKKSHKRIWASIHREEPPASLISLDKLNSYTVLTKTEPSLKNFLGLNNSWLHSHAGQKACTHTGCPWR